MRTYIGSYHQSHLDDLLKKYGKYKPSKKVYIYQWLKLELDALFLVERNYIQTLYRLLFRGGIKAETLRLSMFMQRRNAADTFAELRSAVCYYEELTYMTYSELMASILGGKDV